MTLQSVTLDLPESLYLHARQVAEATEQPLEVVLRTGIERSLPPIDDVSSEEAVELSRLAALNDASLWAEARTMMSADQQAELTDLLDHQSAGTMTQAEEMRLQALVDLYGRLMVRKAHAFLLLARRGYRVPMHDD